MSKKIKSLIVAGLLMVGMCGNVFANENNLPSVSTSIIEYPEFNDENKAHVSLQADGIQVNITKNDDGTYDIRVEWDSTKFNVTGLKSFFENGNLVSDDFFNPEYHCANILKEGDKCIVSLEGLGDVPEGLNPMGELIKVEVTFENLTKGSNPVTPGDPEEPKNTEKITDPETGDSSSMIFVTTALVSAGALLITKKKDEE